MNGILRCVAYKDEDGDAIVFDQSASFDESERTKEKYADWWTNHLEDEFGWHNVIYSWFIEGVDTIFYHTPADTLQHSKKYTKGYENIKNLRLEEVE